MSVLLVLSLTLNAAVLIAALVAIRRQPEVAQQFMRLGQDQMKSFFDEFRVRPGDIVFLGDSLTAGARWPEMFPGRPVRNRGIRGDTAKGILRRLGPIVRGKPGQVFLMAGTNDLGFGRSVSETLETLEQIIERIRQRSPTTEVIVQSVLPRQADFHERITKLNDELQRVCNERTVRYCDLHAAFANEQGELRPELTNDGLHLLGPGYALWAERIRDLLPPGPPPPSETLQVARPSNEAARSTA